MKSIKEVMHLTGTRVLIRASLNVPIENGKILNDFRLKRAQETIAWCAARGAKVIVISHLGDEPTNSLRPVADLLNNTTPVSFVDDVVGARAEAAVSAMKNGDILILENLRREKGEKENNEEFAQKLARFGDVYVNDDFAAAHRAHASIVSLPKLLPAYAGLLFMKEFEALSNARAPQSPSLCIIGGAKFLTKEPIIQSALITYDKVFVTGALANDFFKALGYETGVSLLSPVALDLKNVLQNSKLILPTDVSVQTSEGREVKKPQQVEKPDNMLDVGPATMNVISPLVAKSRFILWNGPLGNYEKGFTEYTEQLAQLIAASPATSIVGGGDTIASIARLGLENKFTFLSTAGGAMLEFIAKGTLPGIQALT